MFRHLPVGCLSSVAHERVGRRDLFEQGLVGGGALSAAPLPGERLARHCRRPPSAGTSRSRKVPSAMTTWCPPSGGCAVRVPMRCVVGRSRVASQPPLGARPRAASQEGAVWTCSVSMVAVVVTFAGVALPTLPAVSVVAFLRIGSPQTGHLRGRFDRVLMTQSNGPEPARNALICRENQNNTPTRLLPRRQSSNIINTF